jgi:hypothetical protein
MRRKGCRFSSFLSVAALVAHSSNAIKQVFTTTNDGSHSITFTRAGFSIRRVDN